MYTKEQQSVEVPTDGHDKTVGYDPPWQLIFQQNLRRPVSRAMAASCKLRMLG